MHFWFFKCATELDGKKVQMDERANAQRAVGAMQLNKKAFMLEKGAEMGVVGMVSLVFF
jgi:hypothetical protein